MTGGVITRSASDVVISVVDGVRWDSLVAEFALSEILQSRSFILSHVRFFAVAQGDNQNEVAKHNPISYTRMVLEGWPSGLWRRS